MVRKTPNIDEVRDEVIEQLMTNHIVERTCGSCSHTDHYVFREGRNMYYDCVECESDGAIEVTG